MAGKHLANRSQPLKSKQITATEGLLKPVAVRDAWRTGGNWTAGVFHSLSEKKVSAQCYRAVMFFFYGYNYDVCNGQKII